MLRLVSSLFIGLLVASFLVSLAYAQTTIACDPAKSGLTNPACPASDPYCTLGSAVARCTECYSGTDYVCDCLPGLACNVTVTSTLRHVQLGAG